MRLHLLLPLFILAGCPSTDTGKDDTDTADADTDTDTDADSDTDADTDTDADADTPAYTFSGTSFVKTTTGDATDCDVEASLTGTPYTGDCENCEFALNITSEITRDDSTDACAGVYSAYSFIQAGSYSDLVMAYSTGMYSAYGYYYTSVFFSQYYYTGYGTYSRNIGFSYYGYPYGYGLERTGDDISWNIDVSGSQIYNYDYAYCYTAATSYATSAYEGDSGTSSVACGGTTTDVWTFVAGESAVGISVDTTSAATTFDPRFWVNGPDGCAVTYADDNFTCTFPPPTYSCPSANLLTVEAGETYEVVVSSAGDCTADNVDYVINVQGATGLTLLTDDAMSGYDYTIQIGGQGTLTPQ